MIDDNLVGSRYNQLPRDAGNLLCYSIGPSGAGIYPSSGNPYTTPWAAWVNSSTYQVNVRKISQLGDQIALSETGTVLPAMFGSSILSSGTNLSMAFDNSGQFFMGIQDNRTNPPTVRVSGLSGTYSTGWAGYNPLVFNGTQILSGFYQTGNLAVVQSGSLGCLYTDVNSTGLFARYQANNFSVEYPFTLAGATGIFYWIAGMVPAFFAEQPQSIGVIDIYNEETEQGYITTAFNLVGYEAAVSGLNLDCYTG